MSSFPSLSSLHALTASNRQARIVPERNPALGRRSLDGRFVQIFVGVAGTPRRRRAGSQSTVTQAVPGREGEASGHGSTPEHAAAHMIRPAAHALPDGARSAQHAVSATISCAPTVTVWPIRAPSGRSSIARPMGANRCVAAQARATSRSTALSRRPITAPLSPIGPRSSRVLRGGGHRDPPRAQQGPAPPCPARARTGADCGIAELLQPQLHSQAVRNRA